MELAPVLGRRWIGVRQSDNDPGFEPIRDLRRDDFAAHRPRARQPIRALKDGSQPSLRQTEGAKAFAVTRRCHWLSPRRSPSRGATSSRWRPDVGQISRARSRRLLLIVAVKITRWTNDELPSSRLWKTWCMVELAVGGDHRGAWCRVRRFRAGTCGERKRGSTCQDDMLEHRVHALRLPGFISSDFHCWALTATSVAASRLACSSSLITCSRLSDF